MDWTYPSYSNNQVDKAGKILAERIQGDEEWSLQVVNNWRASHSFPLNTLQMRMRTLARSIERTPVVAQRIKRLSSIKAKLCNEPTMQLSRMQDIGGCRAVFSNVQSAYKLNNLYIRPSRVRHEFVKENDYIAEPKESGYRSIHRVYAYSSDRTDTYNGLLIEIQIRSRHQHAWATAVETVDTFTNQALKASRGDEDWKRFFILMGSFIALEEKTALVPNTPATKPELMNEIKEYATKLDVETKLRAFHNTLSIVAMPMRKQYKYFLLIVRPSKKTAGVKGYTSGELTRATKEYLEIEESLEPDSEAVLVSVAQLKTLRRAYPNYFADTTVFVNAVQRATSDSNNG